MIPTTSQVADALNSAQLPVAATRVGVEVDASDTAVTLGFGLDEISYEPSYPRLQITLGTSDPISVPVRDGQTAEDIATTMIDSILPATHEPEAAPKRSRFHGFRFAF